MALTLVQGMVRTASKDAGSRAATATAIATAQTMINRAASDVDRQTAEARKALTAMVQGMVRRAGQDTVSRTAMRIAIAVVPAQAMVGRINTPILSDGL
jgi:hypothetical protein